MTWENHRKPTYMKTHIDHIYSYFIYRFSFHALYVRDFTMMAVPMPWSVAHSTILGWSRFKSSGVAVAGRPNLAPKMDGWIPQKNIRQWGTKKSLHRDYISNLFEHNMKWQSANAHKHVWPMACVLNLGVSDLRSKVRLKVPRHSLQPRGAGWDINQHLDCRIGLMLLV